MVKVMGNGFREIRIVGTGMKIVVAETEDRAQLGIARVRETNDFTTDPIFLCSECKGGKSGRSDVSISGKEKVEAVMANMAE